MGVCMIISSATMVGAVFVLLMIDNRLVINFFFFFQAEDGIRDVAVTGVQTCALPISQRLRCGHSRLSTKCHREHASRIPSPGFAAHHRADARTKQTERSHREARNFFRAVSPGRRFRSGPAYPRRAQPAAPSCTE